MTAKVSPGVIVKFLRPVYGPEPQLNSPGIEPLNLAPSVESWITTRPNVELVRTLRNASRMNGCEPGIKVSIPVRLKIASSPW